MDSMKESKEIVFWSKDNICYIYYPGCIMRIRKPKHPNLKYGVFYGPEVLNFSIFSISIPEVSETTLSPEYLKNIFKELNQYSTKFARLIDYPWHDYIIVSTAKNGKSWAMKKTHLIFKDAYLIAEKFLGKKFKIRWLLEENCKCVYVKLKNKKGTAFLNETTHVGINCVREDIRRFISENKS